VRKISNLVLGLVCGVALSGAAFAASQDAYDLPEPYVAWEKAYSKEFPAIQGLMDTMTANSKEMLSKPSDQDQDILHNRVCAAIAYKMAVDRKGSAELRKLGPVTDILHNISKDNKKLVLSDPDTFRRVTELVADLKQAGRFKKSPEFFSDPEILKLKPVATNLALIHHLTGAVMAGDILTKAGGFSKDEIRVVQTAIVAHSTGYWYFRDSIDAAAGREGAWKVVFPVPENDIDNFAHDADLISQFVPESVTPDGSKWRNIATKRWGATNTKEEGQVVYYVFSRLYDEAKTDEGRAMALEKWNVIKPELIKLMGLKPDEDPIKTLGVPAFWAKKGK